MINDVELCTIRGGINYGLIGIITGIVTFIIGVIDGYQRPISCNE